MEFIRSLENLNKGDTSIAGGKGSSLGEMIQAGFPVPEGFVVLSATFDRFLKETGLTPEIHTILESIGHALTHDVEDASRKIRRMIEDTEFPEDIGNEILAQYHKFSMTFVAVRSSATSEDGSEHAWAGQLSSFLNTSQDSLLENVKKCWSSLFTPRAIVYRFDKKLQRTEISVAVVVQKMTQAEISGIAFSVHPITQDPNQMIIEAGYGLGEAIVSGSITPDSYVIEKDSERIIDTTKGTQTKGLFVNLTGSTVWKELTVPETSSQVLSEKQVLELAKLILNIEKHYGFPCDIEWAYENGKFYILQSRPITTLEEPLFDSANTFEGKSMVFMGKRLAFIHESKLKMLARSKVWKRELGLGYETAVMNSLGEYFVDKDSANQLSVFFESKDFEYAEYYVTKLYDLRDALLKLVIENPERDLTVEFSILMAYFFIVKSVYEEIYTKLCTDEQMKIERWRNDDTLFAPLELYYEHHPEDDEKSDFEWSWIWNHGTLDFRKELVSLRYKKKEDSRKAKILSQQTGLIQGKSAFPGIVRGRVRVILSKEDKELMQKGEIIVAAMTTVDFLPIMKKAAAFVTDEGGITSHAAIIAREMKKPSVIGTGIATQVLKTGMEVEVDATNGIIRIVK